MGVQHSYLIYSCSILCTAPQIGFDPQVYVIDEEAGNVILQIITNAPSRFSNSSGALIYTTHGTATSNGGLCGIML